MSSSNWVVEPGWEVGVGGDGRFDGELAVVWLACLLFSGHNTHFHSSHTCAHSISSSTS